MPKVLQSSVSKQLRGQDYCAMHAAVYSICALLHQHVASAHIVHTLLESLPSMADRALRTSPARSARRAGSAHAAPQTTRHRIARSSTRRRRRSRMESLDVFLFLLRSAKLMICSKMTSDSSVKFGSTGNFGGSRGTENAAHLSHL